MDGEELLKTGKLNLVIYKLAAESSSYYSGVCTCRWTLPEVKILVALEL